MAGVVIGARRRQLRRECNLREDLVEELLGSVAHDEDLASRVAPVGFSQKGPVVTPLAVPPRE